jgi:hypothetical protein
MTKASRILLSGTGVVAVAASVIGATAMAYRVADWKGAESFTQTGLAPNLTRCGPLPDNLEGRFAGSGIDTAHGTFAVTTSGCVNAKTLRVSDLEATDTYLRSGDSVRIETDDFTLGLDSTTCVASNRQPVAFRVAGGTGGLTGATGRGHFDIAMNWTPCNGLVLPAHVWFNGELRAGG